MRTPDPWPIPTTPFRLEHVAGRGVSRAQLRTALADGRVVRLRHGVFVAAAAVAGDVEADHLLRALADQTANPDLVLDRTSAALAHGLPLLHPSRAASGPATFARPAKESVRGTRGPMRRVRLVTSLPAHHVVTLPSGLRVTSPARTAVDLAAGEDLPEALMALDAAARLELVAMVGSRTRDGYRNPRVLAAALRPLGEAGTARGRVTARLSRALALADPRRESPLESFSAGHFALAGIPRPVHQRRLVTAGGTFYPDNLWEEYRLIGEADGEGKYVEPSAVTAEKLRDGHLLDSGYGVQHWSGHEMFGTPHRVVARLSRLLVAAGWDGVPRPW